MSSTLTMQSINELVSDMTSFAHFMYKPADFMVTRRLAPPTNTLQFYIDSFDAAKATTDAYVVTIPGIVNDAINNTAVEGGVLADTFVTVTAKGVGTVPRTQAAKNADRITPKDFGGIGDGTSHRLSERYATLTLAKADYPHVISLDDEIDWAAVQALFLYVASSDDRSVQMDWGGNWYLNRGIYYGVKPDGRGHWRSLVGDFNFKVRDDFIGDYVIMFHGRGLSHRGTISGDIRRKVKFGIIVDGRKTEGLADYISFGIEVDRVFIDNAAIRAVKFSGYAMFSTLNFLRTIGNGVSTAYAGHYLDADVSLKTDAGVGTLTSSSNMKVSTLPHFDLTDCNTYVYYNGQVSKITVIDRPSSTITFQPHIPDPAVPEKLLYIWGGGISTEGSDAASIKIGQMSVLGSGIALEHESMYSCSVESFNSEYCGIGLVEAGLVGGVNLVNQYIEGGHADYVTNAASARSFGSTSMLHGKPLNFDRMHFLTFGRKANGKQLENYGGLGGVQMVQAGIKHSVASNKYPNNFINGVNTSIDFNKPHSTSVFTIGGSSSYNFVFEAIQPEMNDLFCYDSQELIVFGISENNAPISVTIKPLDGYTLNGGTSDIVYSNFKAAAHFAFFLNVASKDISISLLNKGDVNFSAPPSPAPYASLDGYVETSYHWVDNYTTIVGMPTPTRATNKASIKMFYPHSNKDSGLYLVTQLVSFPDINEVWERNYSKLSGTFSGWVLKDYVIRKGATSERPVNPQLGMQFYDTTLLGAGKPINWNGTVWVDAMGVAV